ncbi:MAG: phytoene/squalene synthase family protein [Chitinophagales bacterium]|nr:phytoene/squalene synthase family protein [Chitinophagales bacterium]MDW8272659.1 phytoene/squalene synthase family protein [Chitinophagales bacterium]
MFSLFENIAAQTSKKVTQAYSTSFSLGIKTLDPRFHEPIYGIYAFVRFADEIVDTFHQYNKKELLERFKRDTYLAIEEKISLNPVLHSFQKVVNQYQIPLDLVEAFFKSMEMDLTKTAYGREGYNEYIYGSAEVVGLMCLKVFAEGDDALYDKLKMPARALGAAFQKVNFLRDMKSDYDERGRVYFPGIDFENFQEEAKAQIEREIAEDFRIAYNGIMQLPKGAKSGVLLAYKYYMALFRKIQSSPAKKLKDTRIRVPDTHKFAVLLATIARTRAEALLTN